MDKYKVDIVERDGGYHGITINGEPHRATITVDYVAQMSVWLVNLNVEYGGVKANGCEYLYGLNIGMDTFESMAGQIQASLNG